MPSDLDLARTFREVWAELSGIGRAPDGGYLRFAWSPAEIALRDWFRAQATARGMTLTHDGNGNLFATWFPAGDGLAPGGGRATADGLLAPSGGPGGVLTGSHFDSVPHGGAFDGPLGIVSAFLAVDLLRDLGFRPERAITVAAFAEEEGSRFGLACLGSRLLTGAIDPQRAAALTDRDGLCLGDVLGAAPAGVRPDLVAGFDAYVELHVEQGRALTAPVGVASAIWPHGRWRFDVEGEGNHAGTTLMSDRRDPMLTYAFTVLAANKEARLRGAHATVGRVEVRPNATNAIPAAVRGWLDARAADEEALARLVEAVAKKATERAGRDGTAIRFTAESTTGEVRFDTGLADRLATLLGGVPILPTGAGHDAGVLSAHLPTAMLFVRNPTGVSHAPAESATDEDCAAGVRALARVLQELSRRPLVDHDEGVAGA
ncbi:allantoate amidohydrolase [Asanoa iriomotensis]|uniref:Zn-dependent hydrolase n=1 Tax=Asanoa iriomotensis TaxID=234613 RepID=A0ABQ4BW37_9ACTN|nr:allantoate amidohydrolase [Asanoa iriomotensis]GIF54741.1 Zn-dependent hydrolase [Asanoa iriomotensis]